MNVELDVIPSYDLADLGAAAPSTVGFSVTDDVTGHAPVGLVGSWVSLVLDDVEITPVEY